MFFMRSPEDLSAMDGDITLMEYCEELPPLLSQAGMNTRIKNYHKRVGEVIFCFLNDFNFVDKFMLFL